MYNPIDAPNCFCKNLTTGRFRKIRYLNELKSGREFGSRSNHRFPFCKRPRSASHFETPCKKDIDHMSPNEATGSSYEDMFSVDLYQYISMK